MYYWHICTNFCLVQAHNQHSCSGWYRCCLYYSHICSNFWSVQVHNRARWFLWNVSANSHMTSVTKRNMLDPTGKVGDCSYTLHNYHTVGWIFFTRQKMMFFIFAYYSLQNVFRCVFNHRQLPRWASTQHICVLLTFPTPRTSPTLMAEKYLTN